MIGVRENKIIRVPLVEAVKQTQAVAEAIGQKDFETAMKLRDPEFKETLLGFLATSALDPKYMLPPEKVRRIYCFQG
jgi:6-phosphofructokinase 1